MTHPELHLCGSRQQECALGYRASLGAVEEYAEEVEAAKTSRTSLDFFSNHRGKFKSMGLESCIENDDCELYQALCPPKMTNVKESYQTTHPLFDSSQERAHLLWSIPTKLCANRKRGPFPVRIKELKFTSMRDHALHYYAAPSEAARYVNEGGGTGQFENFDLM